MKAAVGTLHEKAPSAAGVRVHDQDVPLPENPVTDAFVVATSEAVKEPPAGAVDSVAVTTMGEFTRAPAAEASEMVWTAVLMKAPMSRREASLCSVRV